MVTEAAVTNQPTEPPVVLTALKASDPTRVDLSAGKPQLVEAFAFWSPLCKSMAPVVNRLEFIYSNRVNFVYLDIDDARNKEFLRSLGYKRPPHFFLLDGQGTILRQWMGYVSTEELEAAILSVP